MPVFACQRGENWLHAYIKVQYSAMSVSPSYKFSLGINRVTHQNGKLHDKSCWGSTPIQSQTLTLEQTKQD